VRYNADEIGWDEEQAAVGPDGEPITGEVVYYAPGGGIEAVVGYRKGFKDGLERRYYPDGTLEYEGEWTWSRGVGVHRGWYPGGQPREELLFDNGRLIRAWRWREDGSPIEPPSART
jgi:antitoxin component YwqK of YwqJK toxin-antitoxin module